jgi:limonene-1,2-epoxide hydrolase
MPLSRKETELAYRKHRALHEAAAWPDLADLFAEHATYEDPFFGRISGRDAIRAFLEKSMTGLEDWTFPIQWTAIDEGRVVTHWLNRLPGTRRDGSPFEFPGMSAIAYDEDGLIVSQMDLYDRARALQVIAEARSRAARWMMAGARAAASPVLAGTHWLVARRRA